MKEKQRKHIGRIREPRHPSACLWTLGLAESPPLDPTRYSSVSAVTALPRWFVSFHRNDLSRRRCPAATRPTHCQSTPALLRFLLCQIFSVFCWVIPHLSLQHIHPRYHSQDRNPVFRLAAQLVRQSRHRRGPFRKKQAAWSRLLHSHSRSPPLHFFRSGHSIRYDIFPKKVTAAFPRPLSLPDCKQRMQIKKKNESRYKTSRFAVWPEKAGNEALRKPKQS